MAEDYRKSSNLRDVYLLVRSTHKRRRGVPKQDAELIGSGAVERLMAKGLLNKVPDSPEMPGGGYRVTDKGLFVVEQFVRLIEGISPKEDHGSALEKCLEGFDLREREEVLERAVRMLRYEYRFRVASMSAEAVKLTPLYGGKEFVFKRDCKDPGELFSALVSVSEYVEAPTGKFLRASVLGAKL